MSKDIDSRWNQILELKSSLEYHEKISKKIREQIQELAKA